MGGGISKSKTVIGEKKIDEKLRYRIENGKHDRLLQVEQFLLMVQKSSDKIESVWLLLASDLGQRYLHSFLASEGLEEILNFFQQIAKLKSSRSKSTNTNNTYQQDIKKLCIRYYITSGHVGKILQKELGEELIFLKKDLTESECEMIVTKILNEFVKVFAEHLLFPFIRSPFYSRWRALERSHAVAAQVEDSRKFKRISSDFSKQNNLSHVLQKKVTAVCNPIDMVLTSIAGILESCATEVLEYRCGWLLSLLSASQALPVSFFVCGVSSEPNSTSSRTTIDFNGSGSSKVENQDFDYPFLFVNKTFQKINQRRASAVLGKSFTEVFTGIDLKDVNVMKRLFNKKTNCNVASVEELTLMKLDGKEFKSFVALKPIFTDKEDLCYYLGLQIEENQKIDTNQGQKELLQTWLESLPDVIVVDDE